MRNVRYIFVFCLLSFCVAVFVPAKAQDYLRLGERTIMGTARYVGMSGAMSAIGGDPSAAHDNIAGIGLYRRAEGLISLEVAHNAPLTTVSLPQASFVLSLPVYAAGSKVKFNNLFFSYRRLHTYNRQILASGQNAPSLGALIVHADTQWDIPFCVDRTNDNWSLAIREAGAVNEFNIGWAMNIADQWYLGLGLNIQSYRMSSDATYEETFAPMYNRNKTTILHTGTSVSMSAGMIYRPTGWMRLGVGIETPSLGGLSTYTTGTFTAKTDSVRSSYAPDAVWRDGNFHMPVHLSTSAAFQIGAYGMIALQYDLYHQHTADPIHSLRAGIEVIPVMGMYINAGYACESPFKRSKKTVPMDPKFDRQDTYFMHPNITHYASFAIGYRGPQVIVQAAYQYRLNRQDLYAHENIGEPFDAKSQTHRVVLTIGWHQ